MSGPRQVARIMHKNLRLRARAGYGVRGSRRRFSGDTGPGPLGSAFACERKRPLTRPRAEAVAFVLGIAASRCGDCAHWHTGRPRKVDPR